MNALCVVQIGVAAAAWLLSRKALQQGCRGGIRTVAMVLAAFDIALIAAFPLLGG